MIQLSDLYHYNSLMKKLYSFIQQVVRKRRGLELNLEGLANTSEYFPGVCLVPIGLFCVLVVSQPFKQIWTQLGSPCCQIVQVEGL
jgi:hypothetical protein